MSASFFQLADSTTLELQGYAGTDNDTAAIASFVNAQNTTSPAMTSFDISLVASGTITGITGPVPLPAPLALPLLAASTGPGANGDPSPGGTSDPSDDSAFRIPHSDFQPDDGVLTPAELDFLVDAAIDRWAAAGLSAEQLDALDKVTVTASDMPGWYLGSYDGKTIQIDTDAAGWGWFVDATPFDDSEFGNRQSAISNQQSMDLLTTLLHEFGHVIGLSDISAGGGDDVMAASLTPGVRRVPTAGQADGAVPDSVGATEYMVGPLAIGDLPAGKAVRIFFDATVNAGVTSNLSNQGTVSGTNFTAVLTDDPEVGGTADPTVTPIQAPPSTAYWDGGTTDIAGNGDGASQGGAGTWNDADGTTGGTPILNWDEGVSPYVAWDADNSGNDTAVFGGTAGTVTLAEDIDLGGIVVEKVDNTTYTIGSAGEDNTLNFSSGATIDIQGRPVTITAGIQRRADDRLHRMVRRNDSKLTLDAAGAVTMDLAAIDARVDPASLRNTDVILQGSSTGNSVDSITWSEVAQQLDVYKRGTGTWTVGDVTFYNRSGGGGEGRRPRGRR